MYKKIIASVLALTLVSGAIAAPAADIVSLGTGISASAEKDQNEGSTEGLDYTRLPEEDGVKYVELNKYEGQGDNVVIPATITLKENGNNVTYHVKSISNSFSIKYKDSVKTIRINAPVKTIPNNAFSGCKNLTYVKLPNTVETIGSSAFASCAKLDYINFPGKLKVIGSSAFNGAFSTKATKIELGGYINTIGQSAFANCKNLVSVKISTWYLSAIGSSAFENCVALETLTLPSKFVSGGYDDEIFIPSNFCSNTNLKSINIPSRFKEIHNDAFSSNPNLTKVVLNNGLEKIGTKAFNDCKNLKSIVLPGSIKSIGGYAFGYYDNTPIYGFKFYGCPAQNHAPYNYHMNNQKLTFVGQHSYVWTTTKKATCVSTGYQTGKCICCGGTATRTIPATGRHTYVTTKNARGDIITRCTQCGTQRVVTNIGVGGKTSGIKSAYRYTGKAVKPSIKVKYGSKTLKNGRDYTVKIVNNKKVGKAKVVITGKGAYRGTIVKYFKIYPSKQAIKSVKGAKKAIAVKYKKASSSNASGYQIKVATNKSFSGAKTVKVSRTATTKTIKGLKARKKYYVKVRNYKKVGGKTYYGVWSTVKSVKTK